MSEFKEFPKIARLNREVVVTEKIDGSNAQILIGDSVDTTTSLDGVPWLRQATFPGGLFIAAGSRNRYITLEKDNFGFARWVKEHAVELVRLGPGLHYGEWWGSGIQRGYGLVNGEKRFSLFNVGRWYDVHGTNTPTGKAAEAPACCYVVPILATLPSLEPVNGVVTMLRVSGSMAARGFMKPEGVVAFHSASGTLYKATCEGDEKPKGQQ